MIDVDRALQEFADREILFGQACRATVPLLEQLIEGSSIRLHSINPRVKSASSLREKLGRDGKTYNTLADVKDLVGIRVITYFEDDLAELGRIIESEFAVDANHSYDRKSKLDANQFGYRSIHYVCRYRPERLQFKEYGRFDGVDIEIQTRSILQHAWAEIEHEYYKSKGPKPPEIERRNSILAGVLELADAEFVSIRKAMEVYRSNVQLRIELDSDLENLPLEAISLESFIVQDEALRDLDQALSASENVEVRELPTPTSLAITLKVLASIGIETLGGVKDLIRSESEHLPSFVQALRRWNQQNAGGAATSYSRGISLYHLALFVAASRGAEPLRDLINSVYRDRINAKVLNDTTQALPEIAKRLKDA